MHAAEMLDVKQIWEAQKLEHDVPLLCCAFSPCGKYLLAGAQDQNLLRWELETGAKTLIAGHGSWVQAVAFHPDQKQVLSVDLHGAIYCWEYAAEEPAPRWKVADAHQLWATAAAVTRDGSRWITVGTDARIRLWNAADGSEAGELKGHESEVYSLAVHPGGKTLASGDLMGNILVWNLETSDMVRTIDAKVLHSRGEDNLADVGGVRSLAFNADGTRLAAGGWTDIEGNTFCPGKPAALVFDFASGELKQTLRPKTKSDGPLKGLCFLPDGTIAVQGEHLNATSSLEFFGADSAEVLHAMPRESGYGLHLHPDGMRLAVASLVTFGRGGNGRHQTRDEYTPHRGAAVIYSLSPKPTA